MASSTWRIISSTSSTTTSSKQRQHHQHHQQQHHNVIILCYVLYCTALVIACYAFAADINECDDRQCWCWCWFTVGIFYFIIASLAIIIYLYIMIWYVVTITTSQRHVCFPYGYCIVDRVERAERDHEWDPCIICTSVVLVGLPCINST